MVLAGLARDEDAGFKATRLMDELSPRKLMLQGI